MANTIIAKLRQAGELSAEDEQRLDAAVRPAKGHSARAPLFGDEGAADQMLS